MGLETRKGNFYYYSKQRVNGRVVSRYRGRGSIAQAMALVEREGREEREFERLEGKKEREAAKALVDRERQAWQEVEAAFSEFMISAGYHRHKGQWRKQRVKK